jgi:3-hexulose-6-phosphate synthase
MELQLALDFIDAGKGMAVARSVADCIDVLELGTPFSLVNPMTIVREAKDALPGVRVLADYKIMDAGNLIARMAFDAGADITTVSARTWDGTIEEVVAAARSLGRQVLVDMMGVPEAEMARRGREVEALGADYICVHRAISVKGSASPEGPLRTLRDAVTKSKIAVAGGITPDTLAKVVPCGPDLVIVGSAITSAADPRAMVKTMRGIMGDR